MKLKLPAHLLQLNPELDGETVARIGGGSKFGNRWVTVDGVKFDSQAELRRYRELQLDPDVSHLEVHPKFELAVNGVHICNYIADFGYTRRKRYVCEDVKGARTAVYQLKRRLMWACHRIEVVEIEA